MAAPHFEYQKTGRFFAQAAGNMEELAAAEIEELGAREVKPIYRGVWFKAGKGGLKNVYRINYHSRLLTRVLAPLLTFDCHSANYLLRTASKIRWEKLFSPAHTFAVFATVSNSNIKHSHYAALVLKDAVVDYFKDKTGDRPNISKDNPDVWINLHVENNRARVSLDTSSGSLHRRHYRLESVDAPMQETLAAAIVRLSGWDGSTTLLDPMCGSGTLLSEALMSYCRIPPAYQRNHFGFEYLPDFDEEAWQKVKADAKAAMRPLPDGLVFGSDVSKDAVKAALTNLGCFTQGRQVKIERKDFRRHPGIENATILCNPPYGVRLGEEEKLKTLYKELGDFLKQKCKNSTAYVYCGNRSLIGSLGLRTSAKIPLNNGPLEGRLVKLEIY